MAPHLPDSLVAEFTLGASGNRLPTYHASCAFVGCGPNRTETQSSVGLEACRACYRRAPVKSTAVVLPPLMRMHTRSPVAGA